MTDAQDTPAVVLANDMAEVVRRIAQAECLTVQEHKTLLAAATLIETQRALLSRRSLPERDAVLEEAVKRLERHRSRGRRGRQQFADMGEQPRRYVQGGHQFHPRSQGRAAR